MEQGGEFEQRPEVKPAEQVPFSKPKASPLPWILCAVLLLALGGLLAWKLLDNGDNKQQCETIAENTEEDTKGEGTDDTYATIRKVNKILKDTRGLAVRYANIAYGESYDAQSVTYEYEKGYSTALEWSFGYRMLGLDSKPETMSDFDKRITNNTDFKNELRSLMKKYGLVEHEIADGGNFEEGKYLFYMSDDGYLCDYSSSGFFYISCGHTSWISEEKKTLMKELTDVYVASGMTTREGNTPIYMDASSDDVAYNKGKTYQILTVALSNAGADFYRKGTDGEWKFAFGGQVGPGCSEFNTDELKEAFEGHICYDVNIGDFDYVKR